LNGRQPVKYEWEQIRGYCNVDLYACVALWAKASWRAHSFLGILVLLKQGWRLWRGQLDRAATWVYVQQGEVRGFISVHPSNHIAGLFVEPARQCAGIGSRLLSHAHEIAYLDSVDVYSLNMPARQFYEQHGFKVIDVSPVDGDGEPYALLRMTRCSQRIAQPT
jgi:putative acetyltransferase